MGAPEPFTATADVGHYIAGAITPGAGTRRQAIYNPATGEWTLAAPMHDGRFDHEMALLPDGRVLVVGGSSDPANGEYGALGSVEVYDPAADTWTTLPPMHDRRRWPTLAVLSDGVYVAGGSNADTTSAGSGTVLASVERLGRPDLGIAGPIELDASAPGEYPTEAFNHCGSNDAGLARDAAVGDGGVADASGPDAGSTHRGPGGTTTGCSCATDPAASDPFLALGLALVGLSRRRRSPSGPETTSRPPRDPWCVTRRRRRRSRASTSVRRTSFR